MEMRKEFHKSRKDFERIKAEKKTIEHSVKQATYEIYKELKSDNLHVEDCITKV
jgi:uncharacterized protein (UPF0335 family)